MPIRCGGNLLRRALRSNIPVLRMFSMLPEARCLVDACLAYASAELRRGVRHTLPYLSSELITPPQSWFVLLSNVTLRCSCLQREESGYK